ncbi:hypothetical protein MVEN_00648800 [Mycena venus]|uniref:Uncharacterized protein n=1 Tax=Mycena venus TaxID=2733690 RepID=A0A8H6YPW6_9AGAR|nr:hypothetical protein MVEN_00648800 [Mycena venus]
MRDTYERAHSGRIRRIMVASSSPSRPRAPKEDGGRAVCENRTSASIRLNFSILQLQRRASARLRQPTVDRCRSAPPASTTGPEERRGLHQRALGSSIAGRARMHARTPGLFPAHFAEQRPPTLNARSERVYVAPAAPGKRYVLPGALLARQLQGLKKSGCAPGLSRAPGKSLPDEQRAWIADLKGTLRRDEWPVAASPALLLDAEQRHASMAMDMEIAHRAAVFVGNGEMLVKTVYECLHDKRHLITIRFT